MAVALEGATLHVAVLRDQMVGNNQMFEPAHDMNERVGTGYTSLVDEGLSEMNNGNTKQD